MRNCIEGHTEDAHGPKEATVEDLFGDVTQPGGLEKTHLACDGRHLDLIEMRLSV